MNKWGHSAFSAKKQNVPNSECGFILMPVILMITLLATVIFLLTRDNASGMSVGASEAEATQASYVAEAGFQHALSQARAADCSNYSNLTDEPFGVHSYSVVVAPNAGSPVTFQSTAALDSGAITTIQQSATTVYSTASMQSVTLQPGPEGEDAEIWDQAPNNNYADSAETWVSSASSDTTRSLLRFNTDAIPGGVIVLGATLSLLRQSGSGTDQPVSAHRIGNPWSEDGVTWNSRESGTSWDTAGGDFEYMAVATTPVGPVNQRYEWNITTLVQGWVDGGYPNYGVMLTAAIDGMSGERFYTSDEANLDRRPSLSVTYACECGQVCTGGGLSDSLILSTDGDAGLGGLSFEDKDLAEYDKPTDIGTLYLDNVALGIPSKIDALHVLENGYLILSFDGGGTFGGLSFASEDLIEYNPVLGVAQMYLKADKHFQSEKNVVAVHVLDNENVLLATDGDATLGGLAFSDKDIVEYNLTTREASIYFDGDATTLSKKIMALHIGPNGHIVLTTDGDTTLGGLSFGPDQLVDYDPVEDSAVLYFDGETLFSETGEKITAVHIGAGSGKVPPTRAPHKVLFVVADDGNLTSEEAAHQSYIELWGHTVEVIDDNASQAAFDLAVADNDVAFTTNDIDSNTLGTKLVGTSIGVVTSEDNLSDEFGLSSSIGWESGTDVDIDDNTHYITSPFALGALTVFGSSESLAYVSGSIAPDLGDLASSSSGSGVVTLEAGATMFGGGPAAGRRVQLPWGGSGFHPNNLTADGLNILRRALDWGAGVDKLVLSTEGDAELGGLSFQDTDVIDYDLPTDLATLYLDSDDVSLSKRAYAFHVLKNGHYILATQGDATFAGLSFKSEDLIEYDPVADTATMFLEGEIHFESKKNITSVHILDDGNIVLSADDGAKIDGLTLSDTDLVEYNRTTGEASVYFDGDATTLSKKITAVHILQNGHIVLAADGDTTLGGLSFGADQLIDYDPIADSAALYFDGEFLFSEDSEKVRSLHIGAGSGTAAAGVGGGNDYRDNFNATSFSGSDGLLLWSTDWIEIGESDGPTSNDVAVLSDGDFNYVLRVRDNDNGGEGVEREADLSSCSSADLTFDYRRKSFDDSNDYVTVNVSANGGASWSELDRLSGPADEDDYQQASYSLNSALAANTRIRFLTASTHGDSDELFVDKVVVSCTP